MYDHNNHHDASCCAVQESEGEEAADSRVTLEDDLGRGNLAARQSRVKLQEVSMSWPKHAKHAKHAQGLLFKLCLPCVSLQIGPRLELEVVKVEEGLCDGKVLFHSFVHKTAGQAALQKRHLSEKEQEEQLRAKRRHQQVSIM